MTEDPIDVDLPITNPSVALAQHGERRDDRKSPSQVSFKVLAGIGVVTALLILVPIGWLNTAEWSAWATAVQAFGTVMAFAGAAVAFAWNWLRERDRDVELAKAERRSQATRVYGWLAVEEPGGATYDNPPLIAFFENRSDQPAYKVLIEIVDGRGAGEPVLGPTALDDQRACADVVPPRSRLRLMMVNHGGAMGWRPALQVSFTDASDQHWIRHSFGPLVQLNEPAWVRKGADMGWSWAGILASDSVEPL